MGFSVSMQIPNARFQIHCLSPIRGLETGRPEKKKVKEKETHIVNRINARIALWTVRIGALAREACVRGG